MIFGVGGKLESGKDTLSDYLVKKYSFKKLAFADNLKQLCMHIFGLEEVDCYTTEGKLKKFDKPIMLDSNSNRHIIREVCRWLSDVNNWEVTTEHVQNLERFFFTIEGKGLVNPREVLQFFGTEVLRDNIDDEIHAKIVFKKIRDEGISRAVIADARFPNERAMTKREGGKLILVDCVQTREQESTHRSETGIGEAYEYDFVVENDKTKGLQPLYDKVDLIMESLS